jgi:nucleoside-diphosphate-sugar epimerase
VLNVGTGVATSVNALVELLSSMMGVPARPEYVPVPGGRPYNLRQRASLDRIAAAIGYAPSVTLEEGVAEILRLRGWRRA